jgi:hypothetical protein
VFAREGSHLADGRYSMKELAVDSVSAGVPTQQAVGRIYKVSLWIGILAVFPYLLIFLSYSFDDAFRLFYYVLEDAFHTEAVFLILCFGTMMPGIVSGVPLGLAAILTGAAGLRIPLKTKKAAAFAWSGILLGCAGIAGHIWAFATCQFCQ